MIMVVVNLLNFLKAKPVAPSLQNNGLKNLTISLCLVKAVAQ